MRISGENEMKQFGEKLGRLFQGGEVIELIGDVGAGKTTLTKGMATSLGIAEPVQSPTFTISRIYQTDTQLQLAHYDFYRLQDAGILAAELAEMMQNEQTITVIEWGGAVEAVLPTDRLSIQIGLSGDDAAAREVQITAGGPASQTVLEELRR